MYPFFLNYLYARVSFVGRLNREALFHRRTSLRLLSQVAEGVDTALALADLIKKVDRSYRIDLKYAIIFGGEGTFQGVSSLKYRIAPE